MMELSRDLPHIMRRIQQGWQLRVRYRDEFGVYPFHATLQTDKGRYNTIGHSQRDALRALEEWMRDEQASPVRDDMASSAGSEGG